VVRTTALALAAASAVTVLAQGPTPSQPAALPVTKVVLYKAGVGYFEHLATITGNQRLTVPFTSGQLDDVLKSLTAIDLGDGRVTGVSYESPTPVERRLQALQLPLGATATSGEFLAALRGARVELTTSRGASVGRLLSVESRTRMVSDEQIQRDEIGIVTDRGELISAPLDHTTRVRVVETGLRQEVNRYLDVAGSARDGNARQMVISTTGTGTRQLLVSYVGEAAIWKTTYRLVFPTAAGRGPRLQGWAIVDNISAADWQNVELSLVAGAPQAFTQALSAPQFAERPAVPVAQGSATAPLLHDPLLARGPQRVAGIVRDTSGAVLPGVTVTLLDRARRALLSTTTNAAGRYVFGNAPPEAAYLRSQVSGFSTVDAAIDASSGAPIQRDVAMSVGSLQATITVTGATPRASAVAQAAGAGGGAMRQAPPPPMPSRALIEQRAFDVGLTASANDLGDLFEYRLPDRVTIRRNESALVPILQADITADRVSLWNSGMGTRPRRAVWITNSSDLTLDGGAISLVEAGAFAGEGLMDTVKPGERRLVSYASDLGLVVAAQPGNATGRAMRVRIANGVMIREREDRVQQVYTIRNNDATARTVVIEHPIRGGWSLTNTQAPAETTASAHRFRVDAPAAATTTLTVTSVNPNSVQVSLKSPDDQLFLATDAPATRAALEQALRPLVEARDEVTRLQAELQALTTERNTITADQARVRENMKALQRSAEERKLLKRYTEQLDAQESRLDELRSRIDALNKSVAAARTRLEERLLSASLDMTL
jgi:hypothetical protein